MLLSQSQIVFFSCICNYFILVKFWVKKCLLKFSESSSKVLEKLWTKFPPVNTKFCNETLVQTDLVWSSMCCIHIILYREPKSLPFRSTTMGPYFWKILYGSQWRETINILISFELCPELHIWCLLI